MTQPPDPFAHVTPIRRRRDPDTAPSPQSDKPLDARPPSLRLSRREQRVRRQVNKANQHQGRSTHATGPTTRRWRGKPGQRVLSFAELEAMASDIAQRAYTDVQTLERPGDRKHAATSFAIVTDKLLLLRNRPTQIVAFAAEQQRPGALTLARRLSELAKASA